MIPMRPLLLIAAVLLAAVVFAYWPRQPSPGTPKVPVSGRVTVNGEAGAWMLIRLKSENTKLAGQDRQPVASADERGYFQLSSFSGKDGAVPGDYVATFFWPTNPQSLGRDRLQGRFNNPAKSEFRVTIEEGATVLPTFDLEMPAKDILPLEVDPQAPGSSPADAPPDAGRGAPQPVQAGGAR